MNTIWYFFENLFSKFKIWTTITPWEQGLRVRLGKRVKLLNAGIHFIFPLTDRLYVQPTRIRLTELGRQTLTTQDGHPATISGVVQYSIKDMLLLYQTIQQPEETIRNMVQSAIATFISSNDKLFCSTKSIEEYVTQAAKRELIYWGLGDIEVRVTEFMAVRTLRLVMNDHPANYSPGEFSTTSYIK